MEFDDYFEIRDSGENHMVVLVIYDIVDNKRRLKLMKYLQGFGKRVQKSAFEARLSNAQYHRLLLGLPGYCAKEDSIRVYKIVGNSQITSWGTDIVRDDDDILLI